MTNFRQSPPDKRASSRGSALIAILWVVGLLSIAVFSATQFMFVDLEAESNSNSMFRAEQMADRGIAVATDVNVKNGDPVLRQNFPSAQNFFAQISSEGERLNFNSLLENPEEDRMVLEELFTRWGLRFDQATDVVDNLIDWVDDDDLPTNLGAELPYYIGIDRPHHPFNRPFESLSEVELVNGFDVVMAINPNWKDSFTILSSGELDLNEAPAELIAVTCEVGMAQAELLVEVRDGLDQIRGTDDDQKFETVDVALETLGIPEGFRDRISDRVTVEDNVKRIISVGRSGDVVVERIATIQYTGEAGQILQWSTRRIE